MRPTLFIIIGLDSVPGDRTVQPNIFYRGIGSLIGDEDETNHKPRDHDGAAATERASAQWTIGRRDARGHASLVAPAKAGAEEPRWCRCYGTDLSAVNVRPARCSGSRPFVSPAKAGV